MTEYIERENAIAWFMPYEQAGEIIGADVVIADIKGMKAADVAPVVHGRWKRYGKNLGECSECGEIVSVRNNYCPNCGAKMDGERKDGGNES